MYYIKGENSDHLNFNTCLINLNICQGYYFE